MRPFLTRILICLIPVVLAALVVGRAFYRYQNGEGGFKLGVDLVGGTILVYEIDKERQVEGQQARGANDTRQSQRLAEALKRRIDPSDLYNVIIRPMGEDRVEIILPSGSVKEQTAEEDRFQQLLEDVHNNPDWKAELAGHVFEATRTTSQDLPLEIKRTVDQKHWDKVIAALEAKYPNLKGKFAGVAPGNTDVLIERAGAKGNKPLQDEITSFVAANYKPTDLKAITAFVEEHYPSGQDRKNLGAGDVEHIKGLISQQGSMEFTILANDQDDKAAIDAAQAYITAHKKQLEERALEGKPPLPPEPPPEGFLVRDEPATYAWVEIGPVQREDMHLKNANEADGAASLWHRVADARSRGEALVTESLGRTLIYSRACTNVHLTEAQRQQKKYEYFLLCRTSDSVKVGGAVSITASDATDQRGNRAIGFRFNSAGGSEFHTLTTNNQPDRSKEPPFHRYLTIILDGQIISSASLNAIIDTQGIIESQSGFPKEYVDKIVQLLRSGALPSTLKQKPASENLISPTLGAETVRAGTTAILWAFVLVLVFMVFYYRFAGFVACAALFANLLLTVGFMVLVSATFTLPGLAGLVLMLGMAVDANVLIYERLREERDRGASLAMAIRNGYDRAFPTIIDTHLSSIFTAIVLYAVGNDQLKGFGVSLTAGLIISLFTSLFMTRLLFDIWLSKHWLKKLSMAHIPFLKKPHFDFMRIRYFWFTATGILTVLGLGLFLVRGAEGLNIDFTGGTSVTVRLDKPRHISDVRAFFSHERQQDLLAVKSVEQRDDEGLQFRITYQSDGAVVPVQLQERAPGTTPAEREAWVKKQASQLPNWAVEQIFASGAPGAARGLSDLFTVRTSEKERVLVLTAVDRLVREDGLPVLQKATMNFTTALPPKNPDGTPVKDWRRHIGVTFASTKKDFNGVSPDYVRSVLFESLKAAGFKQRDINVTVHGEGQNKEGDYQQMTLDLSAASLAERTVEGRAEYTDAQLVQALKSAQQAFNTRPQPEKLENFDSALAAETQTKALYAIALSWGAILLYLWFRFGSWTFGAAAVLCLIHDLCFTLGCIAACHFVVAWVPGLATILRLEDFKIDLQTVAALLTLVGYSVNDTIVVFDRIREVRGKNPVLTPQTINDSVNQTLSRTILTATTVFLVVLVLYIFGGEGLHLFAFVMVVGVIVGTYSSIYVASPLLLMFGEGRPSATAPVRARPAPAPQPV